MDSKKCLWEYEGVDYSKFNSNFYLVDEPLNIYCCWSFRILNKCILGCLGYDSIKALNITKAFFIYSLAFTPYKSGYQTLPHLNG